MKKVINGKRYDTDTAKSCGYDSYSNSSDFNYWYEELYRKNNGEFFLYGEGGPMSRYAVSTGQNSWSGGEKIIPLSVESAQKWAEEHLSGDEYEAIFGRIEEDDTTKMPWTIRVSPAIIEKVRRTAGERKMTLSEIVEMAITSYIG